MHPWLRAKDPEAVHRFLSGGERLPLPLTATPNVVNVGVSPSAGGRTLRIASIRRWPRSIRQTLLFVGLLAIGSYINCEILDIAGSRLPTFVLTAWTDFEITDDQGDQFFRAAVPFADPLPAEYHNASAWTPPRPGLPIQPRSRRIVSGASRTPGAARITSPSADPV